MTALPPIPADAVRDGATLAADLDATFDHFAVAGRRIRDLLPLWRDALGGRFTIGADNAGVGWRTVRLELGGASVIELIEPLQGSPFFDAFFRRHPGGGLHHVTLLVDDIQAGFVRLAAGGYEPFGMDAGHAQLFVHPRSAGGVLLQLMRRHAGAIAQQSAAMTIEDVLAGRGINGTGLDSP
jgi:methylmalonyl-CoA/ethylmalonyl-CoA epimerase